MGLGWILLTTGAPKVPAAEAALLGVLEVVLAPIWVWLAFDEVPSGATLLGGGLVLAAVLGHVAQDLRREVTSVLPCRDLTWRCRSPHRPASTLAALRDPAALTHGPCCLQFVPG